MSQERHTRSARQGRLIALVIAGAGLASIFAPWITSQLGLGLRYEMLIYFAALGAFVWAGIVTYQLWRRRDD